MEAFKEKSVGLMMILGVVVSVLSALATFAFAGGSIFHATATRNPLTNEITDMGDGELVKFGLLGIGTGILMVVGAMAYGLCNHRTRHTGITRDIPNVRVIARFGFTKDWTMLTETWQFEEAENPTYYLKLELSPGVINEYECQPETYFSAGEGMYGSAVLQGKWCGRFTPYTGMRQSESD